MQKQNCNQVKAIGDIFADMTRKIQAVPEDKRLAQLSGKPIWIERDFEQAFLESDEAKAARAANQIGGGYFLWGNGGGTPVLNLHLYLAKESQLRVFSGVWGSEMTISIAAIKRKRSKDGAHLLAASVDFPDGSFLRGKESWTLQALYKSLYELFASHSAMPVLEAMETIAEAEKLLGSGKIIKLFATKDKFGRSGLNFYTDDSLRGWEASVFNPEIQKKAAELKKRIEKGAIL